MVLSSGAASGIADAGILIDRGSDSNVAFIWDESQGPFCTVNTIATDNSANDISISSYSDLKVNKLLVGTEELTDSSLQSLNDIVGATAGVLTASKAAVVDANKHVDELKTKELYLGDSGSAVKVNATAAEINFLSGIGSGEINNGAIAVYGSQGELNTAKLQLNGFDVDADASEINILQGATGISSNNLNHLSNLTENVQAGLTSRYTKTAADANFAVKAGSSDIITVGALSSGSAANGFGNIDIGTKDITAGSISIDNAVIDGAKIGHTDDVDLWYYLTEK